MTCVYAILAAMMLLRWVGVVRIRPDGSLRLPVSVSPWWIWKSLYRQRSWFGVFRNRPGIVKWERGRLLPRRWGFRFVGLEIGDRGC